MIQLVTPDYLVIEKIVSYGQAIGQSTIDTIQWIGRFIQQFLAHWRCPHGARLIYRKDVKEYLCRSLRAKDAHIRQAIIDRYPATGGGKTPQIGTKKDPGPLYGIKSHLWSALAVGLTAEAIINKDYEPREEGKVS